jgi:hypothetical protein
MFQDCSQECEEKLYSSPHIKKVSLFALHKHKSKLFNKKLGFLYVKWQKCMFFTHVFLKINCTEMIKLLISYVTYL